MLSVILLTGCNKYHEVQKLKREVDSLQIVRDKSLEELLKAMDDYKKEVQATRKAYQKMIVETDSILNK